MKKHTYSCLHDFLLLHYWFFFFLFCFCSSPSLPVLVLPEALLLFCYEALVFRSTPAIYIKLATLSAFLYPRHFHSGMGSFIFSVGLIDGHEVVHLCFVLFLFFLFASNRLKMKDAR